MFCFNITVLSKIFFIRQPDIIYDRIICSLAISLSYPRAHSLSYRFLLSFICSWLSNKPRPANFNSPMSLLLSMSSILKK